MAKTVGLIIKNVKPKETNAPKSAPKGAKPKGKE